MKKILLFILFYNFSFTSNAQCYGDIYLGAHAITLKADGTMWGWGDSSWGQLSTNNSNLFEPSPIQVGSENSWELVRNGASNTFAVKNNGTLWGCGSNQFGSLGVNSSAQLFTTFQQITTATNWVKVAPSSFFTIALKTDGTIWAWGQNNYYQLGNSPATAQQLSPIQVGTATDWIDIGTSFGDTSFAIKADGTIWGWGANTSYLLYFGSSVTTVPSPTQVNADTNWIKMSVGAAHILAQKTDGTLWSWGGNNALGVGNIPSTTTPQQITTDVWNDFSAGPSVSFAIKNNGTLWAWGNNAYGQLGDGTTINQLFPIQIGTSTNWETVETNGYTTIATRSDGTVWAWGSNYYGGFGNGTYNDSNIPIQITNICVETLASTTFEKDTVFSLYPNPANDLVTIAYDINIDKATVEIYDISGRVINQYALSSSKGELQLNTSSYQSGVYIVVVKDNNTVLKQQKLVVE